MSSTQPRGRCLGLQLIDDPAGELVERWCEDRRQGCGNDEPVGVCPLEEPIQHRLLERRDVHPGDLRLPTGVVEYGQPMAAPRLGADVVGATGDDDVDRIAGAAVTNPRRCLPSALVTVARQFGAALARPPVQYSIRRRFGTAFVVRSAWAPSTARPEPLRPEEVGAAWVSGCGSLLADGRARPPSPARIRRRSRTASGSHGPRCVSGGAGKCARPDYVVFELEEILGLAPGSLARHLGYVSSGLGAVCGVEEDVWRGPLLDPTDRQALTTLCREVADIDRR